MQYRLLSQCCTRSHPAWKCLFSILRNCISHCCSSFLLTVSVQKRKAQTNPIGKIIRKWTSCSGVQGWPASVDRLPRLRSVFSSAQYHAQVLQIISTNRNHPLNWLWMVLRLLFCSVCEYHCKRRDGSPETLPHLSSLGCSAPSLSTHDGLILCWVVFWHVAWVLSMLLLSSLQSTAIPLSSPQQNDTNEEVHKPYLYCFPSYNI